MPYNGRLNGPGQLLPSFTDMVIIAEGMMIGFHSFVPGIFLSSLLITAVMAGHKGKEE